MAAEDEEVATAMPVISDDDSANLTLLGLPAELRNRVYRFVLVQDEKISITYQGNPKTLGLLGACRQIRYEAVNTYYQENTFKIEVISFDSALLRQWLCSNHRADANTIYYNYIHESFNWNNLEDWIKVFCSEETLNARPGKDPHCKDVIGPIFNLVDRWIGEGRSWEDVEEDLKDIRQLPKAQDSRWV